MTTGYMPIRRIALVTDPGEDFGEVFAQALGVALATRAELFPLQVDVDAPESSPPLPPVRTLLERWGRLLPGAPDRVLRAVGVRVHPLERRVEGASLRERLAGAVDALAPDLLILSPERAGDGAERPVARDLPLPALFLPPRGRPFVSTSTGAVCVRRVVVAVGADVENLQLLDVLVDLLASLGVEGAHLVIVHVGSWSTLPVERLPTRTDWSFRVEVRSGGVVAQLLEAIDVHRADLVALASVRGRPDRTRVFGSITARVLGRARCPILTVPLSPERPAPSVRSRVPARPPANECWA
jgi:nucleotide-binding universal stress UspA family protein